MFEPTESDCQWMRNLIRLLKIDGLWRTSFALYKKVGDHDLELLAKIYTPLVQTDNEISKVQKSLDVMGYNYHESSALLNIILPDNPMKYFKNGEDILALTDNEIVTAKLHKCPKCGFWYVNECNCTKNIKYNKSI